MAAGSLELLDTSTPGDPRPLSTTALFDHGDRPMLEIRLALADGRLYAALTLSQVEFASEIYAVDVTDPAAPRRSGKTTVTDGYVWDIAVERDGLLAAAGWACLRAVDFRDPAQPAAANVHLVGWAQNVAVEGAHAHALRIYGGLATFEVSDPARPALEGQWPLRPADDAFGSFPTSMAMAGPLALVVDQGNLGVQIIDTSEPHRPAHVGSVEGLEPVGVAAQGHHAYVTDHSGEVIVLDISQAATPAEVGRLAVSPWPSGIAVSGAYAYVVTAEGLRVFDVRDAASPQNVAFVPLPPRRDEMTAGNVLLAEDRAYVVYMEQSGPDPLQGQFTAVDVRDPAAPRITATVALPDAGGTWPTLPGLALSGDHVCVAAQSGGLQIVDVAEPGPPRLVATYRGRGPVSDVRGFAATGDLVFAAGGGDGILMFRLPGTPRPTATSPSPSPPATTSPTPTGKAPARLFLPWAYSSATEREGIGP